MKQKERWELFTRLVNEEINTTLERWSNNPLKNDYVWGWRHADKNSGSFGSNHDTAFFYADRVMKLADVLHLYHHLEVRENEDGKPTPCVFVWYCEKDNEEEG